MGIFVMPLLIHWDMHAVKAMVGSVFVRLITQWCVTTQRVQMEPITPAKDQNTIAKKHVAGRKDRAKRLLKVIKDSLIIIDSHHFYLTPYS